MVIFFFLMKIFPHDSEFSDYFDILQHNESFLIGFVYLFK